MQRADYSADRTAAWSVGIRVDHLAAQRVVAKAASWVEPLARPVAAKKERQMVEHSAVQKGAQRAECLVAQMTATMADHSAGCWAVQKVFQLADCSVA